jgi:hypothetical protein
MKNEILRYLGTQDLIQVQEVTEPRKGRSKFSDKAILREISRNEVVIEFDTDNRTRVNKLVRKVVKKLRYSGYNFAVFDHKGRSPHIHVYNIRGLEEQEPSVISAYKRLFLNKYSPFRETDVGLNTASSHLVAVEFKPHFKHGHVKELLYSTNGIDNYLEMDLLKEASESIENLIKKNKFNKVFDTTWLINWASKETLPHGMWNNIIAKNIAITIRNNNLKEEEVYKKFERKDALCIEGWLKWVDSGHNSFGLHELFMFGTEYDISIVDKMKQYR